MNWWKKKLLYAFQLHSCVTTLAVMQLFHAPAWYNFHSLLEEAGRARQQTCTPSSLASSAHSWAVLEYSSYVQSKGKAAKPDRSWHRSLVTGIVSCKANTKPLGRTTAVIQVAAYSETSTNFHVNELQIIADKKNKGTIFFLQLNLKIK